MKKGPQIIIIIFAVVFSLWGALVIYLGNRGDLDLIVTLAGVLLLYIGISAFRAFFMIYGEMKKSQLTFYPLEMEKGSEKTLSFAHLLSDRLIGTCYIPETNEYGVRIIPNVKDDEISKMRVGKRRMFPGYLFLEMNNSKKFREVAIQLLVEKQEDTVLLKPYYVGGRQLFFHGDISFDFDKSKGITTTVNPFRNINNLHQAIHISKKVDGWKSAFDGQSLFALKAAVMGGGGGIITIFLWLFKWIGILK